MSYEDFTDISNANSNNNNNNNNGISGSKSAVLCKKETFNIRSFMSRSNSDGSKYKTEADEAKKKEIGN
eukprot:Pgem_evm1s16351